MSGADINRIVELTPEFQNDVGRQRATPKGRPLEGTYKKSYCSYKLAAGGNDELLKALVSWNRYLEARLKGLDELRRSGGEIEYFIGLSIQGNAGLELGPSLLAPALRLGLKFAFDIYTSDSDKPTQS